MITQSTVRDSVADLAGLPATTASVMQAQNLVALKLADQLDCERCLQVANSLSQHQAANAFLGALGQTPDGFLLEQGLTRQQISAGQTGELTIGQLLDLNWNIFVPTALRSENRAIH